MANESLVAGNKALALSGFQEALAQAAACGEEGEELVATCKGVIPNIMLSIAKDLIKEANYDEAVTKLNEVVAKAKEYAADEVVEEATTLIPQTLMAKGGELLKDKNFAAAAEAYKSALDLDPGEILQQLFATRRNYQRAEVEIEQLRAKLRQIQETLDVVQQVISEGLKSE